MKTELRCSREVSFEVASAMRLRDLAKFVKTANRFGCSVMVTCGERRVDGKSFIELSNLRFKEATKILIETWGWDAVEGIEALAKIVTERKVPEFEFSV